MSRYPESDEGQHGRYNDGHSPHPSRNRKNHTLDFSTLQENPSHPLAGYQPRGKSQPQQQRVSHTPGRSYSTADPDDPPVPSSSNQTSSALFHPHANLDDDPGDETTIPIVRGPGQSYPGDQADSGISHRRISHRVPRRHKTLKHVGLFHGNFVVDSTVPTKLLSLCAHKDGREFTHIRYSAATGDPNDFKDNGFTLRQVHYDPPRRTELCIVMAMYDEDDSLFTRTMHGVMKNIAYLCKRDRSKTWGKDGWKKVVVCIVSDGRQKINSRTLSVIAAIGAYQEGIATNVVNGKPVAAHIYEYTTQISVTPSNKIEGAEEGIVPVQIIFCLKEKSQKKINSHRWFFNAFGPILQPNVCVLLDVGTMPGPSSIYHLWKTFDINSNVGGACGEIIALKGKYGHKLLNPLVAAQNFEYKMSNILDKSSESVFGYITVLPSAFSAYRYIALQNDTRGDGPLQKYFLGETMHGAGGNIFTANLYLAEDRVRIPCWELVSKRGGSWILHYVKSAYAVTDTPDRVPELVSRCRRFLNGSSFAVTHSIAKFYSIYRSSHTFVRKFLIHLELLYHAFDLIFSWFALGNFFISFFVLTNALEDPAIIGGKTIEVVNIVARYSYAGLLLMCFILSLRVGNRLGARRSQANTTYTLAFVGYAILTTYMTFAAIFLAIKGVQHVVTAARRGTTFHDLLTNAIFRDVVIPLSVTIGSYVVASIIHMDPWHMITSSVQYMLLLPSYINILNVHAFANVHVISWGTKLGVAKTSTQEDTVDLPVLTTETGVNAAYEEAMHVPSTKPPKEQKEVDAATPQEDYYCDFGTNMLMAWVLSNALLVAVVLTINGNAKTDGADHTVNGYLIFILYSVALLALVRFIGSTMYMTIRLFAGE